MRRSASVSHRGRAIPPGELSAAWPPSRPARAFSVLPLDPGDVVGRMRDTRSSAIPFPIHRIRSSMAIVTCDLFDAHPKAQSCDLQFRSLGQRKSFAGRIRTIRCHEDNQLVKETLARPSEGEVLVVDGGGSLHTPPMGDMIAKSGMNNGWAGVIINGAVRDSETLDGLDFAAKALGSNPRK